MGAKNETHGHIKPKKVFKEKLKKLSKIEHFSIWLDSIRFYPQELPQDVFLDFCFSISYYKLKSYFDMNLILKRGHQ